MRLIGIGLLAFVLAGAAISLSSLDIWQRGWRVAGEVVAGPQLVFDTRPIGSVPATRSAVIARRSDASEPLILSGLPSYQSATFLLPRDTRAQSGRLHVDVTIQALTGVEGVLRVSIRNTRRGELLLRRGEAARSFEIELDDEDLSAGRLDISFSLQGRGPTGPCDDASALSAVVEIEPTTALHLVLDRPLATARDRLLVAGNHAHFDWSLMIGESERATRLAAAATLLRSGYQVSFDNPSLPGAFDADEARDIVSGAGSAIPRIAETEAGWPVPIASGTNAGMRRFTRATSWRSRYEIGEPQRKGTATAMQLDLALGPLPVDAYWTVTVTLNGRLVHVGTASGQARDYLREIALPLDAQTRRNTIEITVSSSFDPDGICNAGPEYVAELRPGTSIVGGGPDLEDGLDRLLSAIAGDRTASLRAGAELSPPQAVRAARILSDLLQAGVRLETDASPANALASVVTPDSLGDETLQDAHEPRWIVWLDENDAIRAELMSGVELRATIEDLPVAIMMAPGGQGLDGKTS